MTVGSCRSRWTVSRPRGRPTATASWPRVAYVCAAFEEYLQVLEERFVIADPARRRELVRDPGDRGCRHRQRDSRSWTTRSWRRSRIWWSFPRRCAASFKPEYLELPREVIVTPMQKHQRYFPVVDAAGELLPHFVTISNMRAKDMELIREGNERVLRARLNDAEFFFREDRKRPLPGPASRAPADHLPGEARVRRRQGAAAAKAGRMDRGTAGSRHPGGRRARRPPLQGRPLHDHGEGVPQPPGDHGTGVRAPLRRGPGGRARRSRSTTSLASPGDRLPASSVGAAVALADRLDSIVGCFGIGLVPTGSEDPYALRRAALGVVQTILQRGVPSAPG